MVNKKSPFAGDFWVFRLFFENFAFDAVDFAEVFVDAVFLGVDWKVVSASEFYLLAAEGIFEGGEAGPGVIFVVGAANSPHIE